MYPTSTRPLDHPCLAGNQLKNKNILSLKKAICFSTLVDRRKIIACRQTKRYKMNMLPLFLLFYLPILVVSAIKMLPLDVQITTDRYIDPNSYTTVVGSRVSLPCNTTPSTGDDQVALLLSYKEDSPASAQSIGADTDKEPKNDSKEDKFLNHKARPIYSIDAREAPLLLATHFPGDFVDSDRLAIRFEPTSSNVAPQHQQVNSLQYTSKDKSLFTQNTKQRKKTNRKSSNSNRHSESDSPASGDQANSKQSRRLNHKGMVYLEISNVKKQDMGTYRCRVDYRRGRTINWIINLSVSVPTTKLDIFDQNSMLDSTSKNFLKAGPYNEGSEVNLTCVSDGGLPPPLLRWYHDDKLMENAIELPSTKTDQISLLLPLPKMARSQLNELYMCKAFTNHNQSNSLIPSLTRTVSIDLNLKPKEVKIISSVDKLSASKSLELVCQISGFRPSAKLIWLLLNDNKMALDQLNLLDTFSLDAFSTNMTNSKQSNNNNETASNQISLRSEFKQSLTRLPDLGASQSEDGLTLTGFLSFRPSIEDNGRRVACIAFNPYFIQENHYIYDSITLEIKFPPIVYLAMGASVQHEVILKGYDVFFQCNVQANPSITDIGWTFNDLPLKSDERLGIQITNTSLLLKNVYSVHSGQYLCYATNNQGTGQSEVIQLNVQYKPFCKQSHRLYVGVSQGESVVINCEMDANPSQDLQYIWTLNGIELPNNPTSISESPDNQPLMRFEANRSQLIYTPRKPQHYGQFKCIGISSLGSSDEVCMMNLVQAAHPDVLSNCTQFNLTQQSFTLSCLPGFNGGLEQSFHLELWIKQENTATSRNTTSNNEQSNELSPIQNLPTITSSSAKSEDLLILEKGQVDMNTGKLIVEKKNATSSSSTFIDNNLIKSANQPDETTNQNVNYSHLLSSINLNSLRNNKLDNNDTDGLTMNNSVDSSKTQLDKELRKINYGLMMKNSNKLLNMNTLNMNNSETYDRLVRRLKDAKFYLMANLTSFDYPFFSVYSLPVNAEFQLIIYASNSKGRSKELHLSGNTLLASHWQTEIVNETYLPMNPSLILLVIGVIFLVLITSTILFVMKLRADKIKKIDKRVDFNIESMENLNLNHLTMNNVIHDEAIMLNSCTHRVKNQQPFQKCELTLNGHVNFADAANLLSDQNLNVCSVNPTTIITQDLSDGKTIEAGHQLFSSYQLASEEYRLDQNHILRDIYLNQIILPQQDLAKYQNNQMDANHLILNEKLNLLNDQPTTNTHCVLLSNIYSNKMPDFCELNLNKPTNHSIESNLHHPQTFNELTTSQTNPQIEQTTTTISQLELSNLSMQPNGDCQFIYEDRLI